MSESATRSVHVFASSRRHRSGRAFDQLNPKLNQQQLAERLGVAPETISRWLNGALIQSRAMDNLLRVYFAFPQVQAALCGASQDPELGTFRDDRVA